MEKVLIKFTEPSTWRGVIALVGAVGIVVQPDNAAGIVAAVLALIGSINLVRTEQK